MVFESRSFVARLLAGMMIFAVVQAQGAESDPTGFDPAFPPTMESMIIESDGSRMSAIAYLAPGAGPHPTVILLHGYPGNEKNLDLAQSIRRAGWNVLFFHYRGAWGSEGDFSLLNAEADVQSALAFLRQPETAAKLRTDPARIALVGHSMGAHMALAGLTSDPLAVCGVFLDGGNMGSAAKLMVAGDPTLEAMRAYDGLFMLHGWNGEKMYQQMMQYGEKLDMVPRIPLVGQRPVLFIMADSAIAPIDRHVTPLTAALEAAGNHAWRLDIIKDDHSFSANRLKLAERVTEFLNGPCVGAP